jgi:hypothetical protein
MMDLFSDIQNITWQSLPELWSLENHTIVRFSCAYLLVRPFRIGPVVHEILCARTSAPYDEINERLVVLWCVVSGAHTPPDDVTERNRLNAILHYSLFFQSV